MKKCDVLEVDVVHGYFVVTTPSIYIYIKLLLVPCVFRARSGSPRISMEFWLGGGERRLKLEGEIPVCPHTPRYATLMIVPTRQMTSFLNIHTNITAGKISLFPTVYRRNLVLYYSQVI